MEKVYKTEIVKKSNATYDVHRTCIIMKSVANGSSEVIKWLPLDLISEKDFMEYNYSIDDEGDLVRDKSTKINNWFKANHEESWKRNIITPRVATAGIVAYNDLVLVVKRKYPPYGLAFPGGMMELGETIEETVVREVFEETGIKSSPVGILSVLSDPKYDPRWHVVVVYVILNAIEFQHPIAADDAVEASWIFTDSTLLDEKGVESSRIVLEQYRQWRQNHFKLIGLQ